MIATITDRLGLVLTVVICAMILAAGALSAATATSNRSAITPTNVSHKSSGDLMFPTSITVQGAGGALGDN